MSLPHTEQPRIVAKVDQLVALVDALETQLAASRATAANLLSALVAELAVSPPNPLTATPGPAPIANGTRQTSPRQRPGSKAADS